MTHISIWVKLMLINRTTPLRITTFKHLLQDMLATVVTENSIEWAFTIAKQPKMKQIAHELRRIGFSQGAIAELLQISQPSVSAHLATPVEEYENPYFSGWQKLFHQASTEKAFTFFQNENITQPKRIRRRKNTQKTTENRTFGDLYTDSRKTIGVYGLTENQYGELLKNAQDD